MGCVCVKDENGDVITPCMRHWDIDAYILSEALKPAE